MMGENFASDDLVDRPTIKDNSILILGLDIGGTKTGLVLGSLTGEILLYEEMPTPATEPFEAGLAAILAQIDRFLAEALKAGLPAPQAVSVSVGGPLDIDQGIIYSPPHLPTWDRAPLKSRLELNFHLPVLVEHDGNAGALAEFYFGAGRGCQNLVYLTMGTGLGAGIILNGAIYRGTTDTAGEVGHIRLAEDGPLEYGKAGSWEGYSSAAGLEKLARLRNPQAFAEGTRARQIVGRAREGDPSAIRVVEEVGEWLGRGVAMLVDILNPELVVVGTLGILLGDLLFAPARQVMAAEALKVNRQACRLEAAQLGEELGKVSSLMAVIDAVHQQRIYLPASPHGDLVLRSLCAGVEARQATLDTLLGGILQTAQLLVETLQRGNKVIVFGNGGSAAAAQHLAGELVGRYSRERIPLPAIALTADTSVLTCIGNDYAFAELFSRQAQALTLPGDLAIGFTTSGRSENVLRGLQAAAERGAHTVALTGQAGLSRPLAEIVLAVPSPVTARVQEEHDAIIHAWCEVVDWAFAGSKDHSWE